MTTKNNKSGCVASRRLLFGRLNVQRVAETSQKSRLSALPVNSKGETIPEVKMAQSTNCLERVKLSERTPG